MRNGERGYFFALPRLLARVFGCKARCAEFSGAEAHGVGMLVFTMVCVLLGRALWTFVRPGWLQLLFVIVLPLGAWIALLVFYFVNSLFARLLRRLGLYSAPTNNPLQHVVIIAVLTLCAARLIGDASVWLRSLGIFWCALVGLELFALLVLKIRHEE